MKIPVLASAAFALTLLLTACGGGSSNSSGTTPTTPPPPPNTTDQWAWISGSNYASSSGLGPAGVYGTLGTASASNVPGGRGAAIGWTDAGGNLWIFGGYGLDATGAALGDLDDLWKYNPANNQWTWVGGSNAINAPAVYGTQGMAAAQNTPGGRSVAANWTDASGNVWIFGGTNYLISGTGGYLGDLWMFSPTTNMWTWMGGSQTNNSVANYGSMGVPAASNQPGSRDGAFSWTDSSGNFWMFGGYGPFSFDGSPDAGTTDQGDMWEYSLKAQEWTWVGGTIPGIHGNVSPGVYGTEGVPSATNQPGARDFGCSWTDASGNFWMFGGLGWDSTGTRGYLNDLWEFNPSTMQWTWISGSNQANQLGSYGTQGTAAASDVPGARYGCRTRRDASGDLWLYGGSNNPPGGVSNNSEVGDLGDLWEFDPNTKQWTWVSGSNQVNAAGSYGTEGTFASSNTPAGRNVPTALSDSSGNLWLFGGYTANSSGPDNVSLNDLWKFNP